MAKKQKQIPFKSYPDLQKLTVIKVNEKSQISVVIITLS